MESDEVVNLTEVGWTPVAHPKLARIDTLEYHEQRVSRQGQAMFESTQGEVERPTDEPESLGGERKVMRASATPVVVTHGGVRTDTQSE